MVVTVAEIPEADARGEIAELYADIRKVTGEPAINLIYRNLATAPPMLIWAWRRLRPLFAGGYLQEAGHEVRTAMADALHRTPAFPADALGDLNPTDLDGVRVVLGFYLRANPRNLLALAVLDTVLQGDAAGAGEVGTWQAQSAQGSQVDAVPPLPRLAELQPAVRTEVEAVAALLAGGADDMPMPSVVRHLAYWPAMLSLWRSVLIDPEARQRGERAASAMAARSAQIGHSLAAQLDPSLRTAPSDASQQKMMGRTVRVFRQLLPPVTGAIAALSAQLGYSTL